MSTPTRRDQLASELLFTVLVLVVVGDLIRLGPQLMGAYQAQVPVPGPLKTALVILLLSTVVRVGLYYAIRKGFLAAKLLVLLSFSVAVYTNTDWAAGRVAGVKVAQLVGYPLLVLCSVLLQVAALVLMFWPERRPAA